MWLEYIRYRFRLLKTHDLLELTQLAALEGLRNSPRCRCWRVLPAVDDPSLLVLEIEWDPGPELTAFRGSEEFTTIHSALARQVRSLEEADYSVDHQLMRRVLGGPETLYRLAEDIVVGVLAEPTLAWRFQSADGSRRGRLGLWLLEVLGGPDLFSSSFPGSTTRQGPLADDRLDLEERERLLEIVTSALPQSLDEQGRCVVGNLRAHLPLHPVPPSQVTSPLLLKSAGESSESYGAESPPGASERASANHVWYGLLSDSTEGDVREGDVRESALPTSDPFAAADDPDAESPGEARAEPADDFAAGSPTRSELDFSAGPPTRAEAASGRPRRPFQTGVRRCAEPVATARAVGLPLPNRSRPSASLRGRVTGKWPRWRDRPR